MYKDDQELISAYLDNELDEHNRNQVKDRLATDAAFAEIFANFDSQDAAIKETYSSIDSKPLSAELEALVQSLDTAEKVVPIKQSLGWKKALPLAASVAMVAVLIPFIFDTNNSQTLTKADVLNTYPSGQTINFQDDSKMFLSMSFNDKSQRWCREYFLDTGATSTHEIACNSGDGWQTEIVIDAAFPDAGRFMPASGGAQQIDNWIDKNIASVILSVEQEQNSYLKD